MWALLLPDLPDDPAYGIDPPGGTTTADTKPTRRRARFLVDWDYTFGPPPRPRRPLPRAPPPPLPHETRDDSNDFFANVFHDIQMALEEGREIELADELTEEEETRLGIFISELPQPPPLLLPRYAVDLVPPSLSKEDTFNLALQSSVPPAPLPPPACPWAAPAFVPTILEWAWEITDLAELIQVPSDDKA
jgi:hypothetical protein